jgi:predicted lipase
MNSVQALKFAKLSQEVYQDFDSNPFRGFPDKKLISAPATDTQCAILPEGAGITIVFRGSESDFDWETDFTFEKVKVEFKQQVIREGIREDAEQIYPYAGKSNSGALLHKGFSDAYFSVRDDIHQYVRDYPISYVTATGHSLGGALATICAVDIQYNFADKVAIEAYTYGAPKVGNDGFQTSYNERVPNSYRFVNGMDLVPELPRWWQGYRQVDKEFRLGNRVSLNFLSARFKDHDIRRYIEELQKLAAA